MTEISADPHAKFMEKMFASRVDLKNYVIENGKQNDPQNIIDTIDKYASTKQWLMTIGNTKGKILDQAVQTKQPKSVLELGTFIGYSSLRIAAQLPKDTLIITIEADSQSADVARSIHNHAGVADRIKIINDNTENVIPRLKKDFNVDAFDLIFIDHDGSVFLRDFKMLEELGLIKSKTVIVADNIIFPGAPGYLEYVRDNSNYTSTLYEENMQYMENIGDGIENVRDGIEISIRK